MAAQAIHARQGSNTSSTMSMSYPAAPGSPTLTNPDLILPDYDDRSAPDLAESHFSMWNNAHGGMQYQASSGDPFIAGPIQTPTTPIIYGNGTMLSDIGEVTEVESMAGRPFHADSSNPLRGRAGSQSDSDAGVPGHMSPVKRFEDMRKRSRPQMDRRSSTGSNSTVTTIQDTGDHFVDFDDSVSVDDSNFQGDDEESVAESSAEDMTARQAKFMPQPQGLGLNGENRHSTVSISERAEEILANAKRRLTTMEGSLSRARATLSPTSPRSSLGSDTPSPPVQRPSSSATSPKSVPGHARLHSDSSPVTDTFPTRRSASALGAAGGYRQPLSGSQSMSNLEGGHLRSKTSHHGLDFGLEPLSENDTASEGAAVRVSSNFDSFLSPTFGEFREKELTRAASAMQMRDLKDQMQGLKGRISSLRLQAREDSMKRRSLQSLRTPSPFTHSQVDQWYAGPVRPVRTSAGPAPVGRNPWNGELESVDGEAQKDDGRRSALQSRRISEPQANKAGQAGQADQEAQEVQEPLDPDTESVVSEYEAAQEAIREEHQTGTEGEGSGEDQLSDMHTEDGFQDADQHLSGDESDAYSESGDSLYHDAPQLPVSHEDREDAFDYEHFFLHSAMGSFSQQRMKRRGSSGTFTSEDSVETTKGPAASVNYQSDGSLRRRDSTDTMATMDSFETATEGRSSRLTLADDEPGPVAVNQDSRPETPGTTTQFPDFQQDQPPQGRPLRQRAQSAIQSRPLNSSAMAKNRPSVSSFDSTGTQRSFPLVNRPKMNGILTPQGTPPQGSPDAALKSVSETLMGETASVCEKEGGPGESLAIQQLPREDQILVERLVANLGKCVLGLSEVSKASLEARMYRRRINAAKRLLEGMDEPMNSP